MVSSSQKRGHYKCRTTAPVQGFRGSQVRRSGSPNQPQNPRTQPVNPRTPEPPNRFGLCLLEVTLQSDRQAESVGIDDGAILDPLIAALRLHRPGAVQEDLQTAERLGTKVGVVRL